MIKTVCMCSEHWLQYSNNEERKVNLLIGFLCYQVIRKRSHKLFSDCVPVSTTKVIEPIFGKNVSLDHLMTNTKLKEYFSLVFKGNSIDGFSSALSPTLKCYDLISKTGEFKHYRILTDREFEHMVKCKKVIEALTKTSNVEEISQLTNINPKTVYKIKSELDPVLSYEPVKIKRKKYNDLSFVDKSMLTDKELLIYDAISKVGCENNSDIVKESKASLSTVKRFKRKYMVNEPDNDTFDEPFSRNSHYNVEQDLNGSKIVIELDIGVLTSTELAIYRAYKELGTFNNKLISTISGVSLSSVNRFKKKYITTKVIVSDPKKTLYLDVDKLTQVELKIYNSILETFNYSTKSLADHSGVSTCSVKRFKNKYIARTNHDTFDEPFSRNSQYNVEQALIAINELELSNDLINQLDHRLPDIEFELELRLDVEKEQLTRTDINRLEHFINYNQLQDTNGRFNCKLSITESGRLYDVGVGIQCLPSNVRDNILPFKYSYDLDAASIRYYYHVLHEHGLPCNALKTYVELKTVIREYLMSRLDLPSLDSVKELIAAITFGMTVLNKVDGNYCKFGNNHTRIKRLLKLLSKTDSFDENGHKIYLSNEVSNFKYRKLVDNVFFFNLVTEIMNAHSIIVKEGFLYNYRTKQKEDLKVKGSFQRKCALAYQSFESWYMGLIIDELGLKEKEYLTVHDCIYCDIPNQKMNQAFENVNSATGFNMDFMPVTIDLTESEKLDFFRVLDMSVTDLEESIRKKTRYKALELEVSNNLDEISNFSDNHLIVCCALIDHIKPEHDYKPSIRYLVELLESGNHLSDETILELYNSNVQIISSFNTNY